jgi:hypothetical protein
MLGWICEKMATLESTLGGGRLSAFGSTTVGNGASSYNDSCVPGEHCSTTLGTVFGTTHIHPTRLAGVRNWVESQVPWCNAHNVRVRAQMAKLAML